MMLGSSLLAGMTGGDRHPSHAGGDPEAQAMTQANSNRTHNGDPT
jgi:hypothetical protein